MRTGILIMLLIAAVAAYYYFGLNKSSATGPAGNVTHYAPVNYTPLSTGSAALDRVTGVTAVNQGMKTREVLEKVRRSPRQQMPDF